MLDTKQDSLPGSPPTTAPERRGAVIRTGKVIGCPIDDTLLLVIGTGGSMAGALTAELNGDAEGSVTASIVNWELPAPIASDTHGFVALLPTSSAPTRSLATIRFKHGAQSRGYVLAPRLASFSDAAAVVAELAGDHLPTVVDSLANMIMKDPIGRRKLTFITAFLQAGVRTDGCIELVGESSDGEILIQGWARDLIPTVCRVFVSGVTPSAAECAIAVFPRQEVPKDAAGFIGLIAASEALKASDIEGLLFQHDAGWRYLPVYYRRIIAGPLETPSYIRSVLHNARSTSEVLLRLRSAANRFDGNETVSSLPLPVRMGIDHVFHAEGGGFLVSGWLLDPNRHVEVVKLRGNGVEARLDDRWTRLNRADVTSAFADEPIFAGALDDTSHAHGFVAFAEQSEEGTSVPLHLELALRDTRRAFMPLTPTNLPARAAAMCQIRSIDPTDWALPEIVDRQIIPLLCGAKRPSQVVATVRDLGTFDEASGPAIIIGVSEHEERDIAALLALLALDSETKRIPLVLVVPANGIPRLTNRLQRLATLYNVSLRLVGAEGAADVYDLFEAGAQAVSCETVILLAASLVPREAGWCGKLIAAHGQKKESILSPTLAYEDDSIRWAGSWLAAESSDRPLSGRYVGYPVSAVTALGITPIAAASFECCIMPREALFLAGGFSGGYLGSQEKGLDLGLKLVRSGLRSYWLPSVQMLGSDETVDAGSAATAGLMQQIDRKIFNARWAPVLSGDKPKSAQASA